MTNYPHEKARILDAPAVLNRLTVDSDVEDFPGRGATAELVLTTKGRRFTVDLHVILGNQLGPLDDVIGITNRLREADHSSLRIVLMEIEQREEP